MTVLMIAVLSLALQIGDVVHHWEDTEATAEEIVDLIQAHDEEKQDQKSVD